jgi:hypothetical protein
MYDHTINYFRTEAGSAHLYGRNQSIVTICMYVGTPTDVSTWLIN